MNISDFFDENRKAWNQKTTIHIASEFYDNELFLKGKNTLNEIELALLGNISGKCILHLQCHFGQDTLSLGRLGAQVTGVDISDTAIANARAFAADTGIPAMFICCNIYDLPQHLDQQFDIVFTSYGTIGWLPDLDLWAGIISRYLKPGGQFIFAEFHPVVWMFDDDFKNISYDYFNTRPIIETADGTYADRDADITTKTVTWNHSISEILNSLIKAGLTIQRFEEFDYSPYPCFRHTIEYEPGKYRIKHLAYTIPMVFSLQAVKQVLPQHDNQIIGIHQ